VKILYKKLLNRMLLVGEDGTSIIDLLKSINVKLVEDLK